MLKLILYWKTETNEVGMIKLKKVFSLGDIMQRQFASFVLVKVSY